MTGTELEKLFACGELKLLGSGSRRECYEIPNTELCLKCYRDEAQTTGAVAREIRKFRHDERRNTCCQEYRYYQDLKHRLPDYIFAALPERLEQVYLPSRGWCLFESRVRNADGTPCERFSRTYRAADKATQAKLLKEFWLLVGAFAAYAVRFYDPQNILVQHLADGSFRLRVVDFEPSARTLIPIDSLCQMICRGKVIRRAERYLKVHCKVGMRYNGLKPCLRRRWDKVIATEGAAMGLSQCRVFLENKQVNDIFYKGLYKNNPCVVKCSTKAVDSIRNEYELGARLHRLNPVNFPEIYAWHHGPMAFTVSEFVEHEKTLADDQSEGYSEDMRNILETLYQADVVYRDIIGSNFLIDRCHHLKLIDCQFAVDMQTKRMDAWLKKNPKYHFVVFAAIMTSKAAYWDDALFVTRHFPFLAKVAAPFIDRLRLEVDFTLAERFRLKMLKVSLLVQRVFHRHGTRKRKAIERRIERLA